MSPRCAQRGGHQPEGGDRAEQDDPADQRPHRNVHCGQVPEERDVAAEELARKPPQRLDDRREERGEEKPVQRHRDRVARAAGPLREHDVEGERHGAGERGPHEYYEEDFPELREDRV